MTFSGLAATPVAAAGFLGHVLQSCYCYEDSVSERSAMLKLQIVRRLRCWLRHELWEGGEGER